MHRPMFFAVIGFFIGGAIMLYTEWKSSGEGMPETTDAASPPARVKAQHVPRSPVMRATSAKPSWRQISTALKRKIDALRREAENRKARNASVPTRVPENLGATGSKLPVAQLRSKRTEPSSRPPSRPVVDPVANLRRLNALLRTTVRVKRMVVGAEPIAAGLVTESMADEHAKHDKYLIHLSVCVTNTSTHQTHQTDYRDFKLEDDAGLIYAPLHPNDAISADIHPGKTACGGVAFAVFNDSAPARLLYRTGSGTYTPLPTSVFIPGPR